MKGVGGVRELPGRALAGAITAGLLLATACQPPPGQEAARPPGPLLVSAASSLQEPLQALAPLLAQQRQRQRLPPPQFNLGSSGSLKQQIERGAPVDVFIAAGDQPIHQLARKGLLLAGSRRAIASNQLVLVVPARSPNRSLSFQGLGSNRIRRIGIGDSTVPAGDYGRQTLAYFKLSAVVSPKLVPMGSVRAVAQAVATGAVEAGLVYGSDALNVPNLHISAVAPPQSHAPITYLAAVVASSRQPREARALVQALTTPQAQEEFRRHGLLAPAPPAAPAPKETKP
jgi:molybdate transport system substrate-binding protein